MPQYSLSELTAILDAEKRDSLSAAAASQLSSDRQNAMDYYLGDVTKDLPTIPGRSRAVSMDVSDTVEGFLPNLMEIFFGGDEVVKFNPVGPEDTKQAEQETDYINHIFLQKNDGFLIGYAFMKDALLSKTGLVKVRSETSYQDSTETYYGQTDDVFAVVLDDPDIELTEHAEYQSEMPGMNGTGQATPVTLHDFTVVRRKEYRCAKVYSLPPEEFGINRSARTIRDCTYCFHEVPRVQSELIAEGYDADQVNRLHSFASSTSATSEEQTRDTVQEGKGTRDFSLNKQARRVRVTEHYVRLDYETKNEPRIYRITTGGEQAEVLIKKGEPDIEEQDYIPIAAMTPVIQTHRFFGRSIADLVMDIQQIKTALLRAQLDNAYLANNPRPVVSENDANENTIDDMLVSAPGRMIRVKQNATTAIVWQQVPTLQHIFPLLDYMDQTREWRTGITRQGAGLNADALQNQSATAANQLYTAAQAKIKLIARIFAETGWKDLFWLLHAITRKYGQEQDTVRLRNSWVTVNPRNWKTRDDLTVAVGIGTGGKMEQLLQLKSFLNGQAQLIQAGKGYMVSDANIYNGFQEYGKLIGIKDISPFYTDPNSQEAMMVRQQMAQQQPQPNPAAMLAQQRAQSDQAKLQLQAQDQDDDRRADQVNAMLKARGQNMDAALERERIATDARVNLTGHILDHHAKLAANATRPIRVGGYVG